MLAFIDQVVIPFLDSLYGAVGYLGVMLAMTIESAMIPLPSELILPYAGFLVSDPSKLEPITGQAWAFWIVVILATLGNTIGSLIAYAIGAWGGRPLLERYGRYVLIRPHDIELADKFFLRWGPATVFIGRLLPIVRTFISFPAGVARMPLVPFIIFSTAGAFLWSILLVFVGEKLGDNWTQIRHALQPLDTLILVAVVGAAVLFVWWRLGTPGWKRGRGATTLSGAAASGAAESGAAESSAAQSGPMAESGAAQSGPMAASSAAESSAARSGPMAASSAAPAGTPPIPDETPEA